MSKSGKYRSQPPQIKKVMLYDVIVMHCRKYMRYFAEIIAVIYILTQINKSL